MGFGGVATVTGVGIGAYYGTNSSEEIKKEMDSLKSTDFEGKTSDKEEEKIELSQKEPLDTEELITSTNGDLQPNPNTK